MYNNANIHSNNNTLHCIMLVNNNYRMLISIISIIDKTFQTSTIL